MHRAYLAQALTTPTPHPNPPPPRLTVRPRLLTRPVHPHTHRPHQHSLSRRHTHPSQHTTRTPPARLQAPSYLMACPPSRTRTMQSLRRRLCGQHQRRLGQQSPSASRQTLTTRRSCDHRRALSALHLLRQCLSPARPALLMAPRRRLRQVPNPHCRLTLRSRKTSWARPRPPSRRRLLPVPDEQRRPVLRRSLRLPSRLPLYRRLSMTPTHRGHRRTRTPLQQVYRAHPPSRLPRSPRPQHRPQHRPLPDRRSGTHHTTRSTRHCVRPAQLERDPLLLSRPSEPQPRLWRL